MRETEAPPWHAQLPSGSVGERLDFRKEALLYVVPTRRLPLLDGGKQTPLKGRIELFDA
jgi:hypothetical protein